MLFESLPYLGGGKKLHYILYFKKVVNFWFKKTDTFTTQATTKLFSKANKIHLSFDKVKLLKLLPSWLEMFSFLQSERCNKQLINLVFLVLTLCIVRYESLSLSPFDLWGKSRSVSYSSIRSSNSIGCEWYQEVAISGVYIMMWIDLIAMIDECCHVLFMLWSSDD